MAARRLRYRLELLTGWLTARALRPLLGEKELPPQALRDPPPSRILLVRPNHRLGNTLLTTPAIDIFHRAFPEARIDYLSAGAGARLVENLPVSEVLTFDRRLYRRPFRALAFVRELRRRRYDLAVDCGFGSRIDALLVALSGARLKLGVENGVNGFLYNIRAPCPPRDLHKEEKWEHLARSVGLGYEGERMRVVLSPEESAWAGSWLRSRGLEGAARPLGIFVGGRGRKGKRWPLERFLRTAALLAARGRRLLVFVGPEEVALAGEIERALPGGARLVNEPSIRRAAALISRCALFITGDSGPLHLASALEVPVLAVFLKDNWRRWGPRADRGRVLTGGEGLSPEAVAEAAEEMLGAAPQRVG